MQFTYELCLLPRYHVYSIVQLSNDFPWISCNAKRRFPAIFQRMLFSRSRDSTVLYFGRNASVFHTLAGSTQFQPPLRAVSMLHVRWSSPRGLDRLRGAVIVLHKPGYARTHENQLSRCVSTGKNREMGSNSFGRLALDLTLRMWS